jgi:hypothetical protein
MSISYADPLVRQELLKGPSMVHTYRKSFVYFALTLVIYLFWPVVVVWLWWAALTGRVGTPTPDEPHLSHWGGFWLILVPSSLVALLFAWMAYQVLFNFSREIRLSDDGTCEFCSLLRSKRLLSEQIISVRRATWLGEDAHFAVVRYEDGSCNIPHPLDGFPDLLARLRELNPTVHTDRS